MTSPASAMDRPVHQDSGDLAVLMERALSCLEDGEHDQAIQLCEQALAQKKNSPEALHVLGLINLELEDPVTALKLIEAAHYLDPEVWEYAEMLAALYACLGNVNDSLFYAKVGTSLAKHPTISGLLPERFGSFFSNLERGRSDLYYSHARRKLAAHDPEGAISDCETQLDLTPGSPETLRLLAECCLHTGQLSRSASALQAVLHGDQALTEDFAALGDTLSAMGRPEAALACYRTALGEDRGSPTLFSRLIASQLSNPSGGDRAIELLHREWQTDYADPIEPRPFGTATAPGSERVLRIGYVSADFCSNDLMTMVEPVLHAHRPDLYEIYCYADGSRADLITERIQRRANKWTDIHKIDDETLWQILRGDQIDITVDLTGHGRHCRSLMMARRPSPITLSWLGYLHPPGVSQIDYFLADERSWPRDRPTLSTNEAIWRLEDGICAYMAPALMPDVSPLPALAAGHATFGAQCDLRLIDPGLAALWARILRAVPTARLVISNLLGLDQDSVERCVGTFSYFGVRDRVDIVDYSENFNTGFDFYQHIDLALDTAGLNATSETCQALWMGVPVLTLAGTRYAQRRGASLLHAAGRPQWIAEDPDALVTIAAGLASDPDTLAEQRATLRCEVSASNLGNPVRFTRQLEDAYRRMWRHWCAERTRAQAG